VNAPAAITLRTATLGDLASILGIERACFTDPWSERSFRDILEGTGARLRVAEREGEVLGYSVAWILGEEAELANLAVHPDARRLGVGAALVDDLLLATDRGRGATIYLEVRASNAAAQSLYRSRGFVAAGVRKGYYSRPTEDAIVMRREPRVGAAVSPPI
jgi:ribosomal-protein-alanine N-acetyltransferase